MSIINVTEVMLSSCDNVKSEVCTTVFRALCQQKLEEEFSRKEDTITFFLFKRDYTTRSDIAEFFKDNAHFLPNEVALDLDMLLSYVKHTHTHDKLVL